MQDELSEELGMLQEANAALRSEVARLEDRIHSLMGTARPFCQHCEWWGEAQELSAARAAVSAHAMTCSKHPMRAVEAERDQLKAELTSWKNYYGGTKDISALDQDGGAQGGGATEGTYQDRSDSPDAQ